MYNNYLFTSQRLGFRNWTDDDLQPMAAINADIKVMEFFPGTKTQEETAAFIMRMKQQFDEKGYCYFAVDKLDDRQFIGFIGLSQQTFESDFTPCVDIGWRLATAAWGNGLATEGAKRCLQYAFEILGLNKVYAVAPKINQRSVQVMQKIGMQKVKEFDHPLLVNDKDLQCCVLYEISG